jgi:hypothetical protein
MASIKEMAELDLEPPKSGGWTPAALERLLEAYEKGWTQRKLADKLKLRHAQEVGTLLNEAREERAKKEARKK